MDGYSNIKELFDSLKPAFNVKLRLIKKDYDYITRNDIWNYLKINKWCKDVNLTISEMVDDIIMVDIDKVDRFLKEYIKKQERQLVE